MNIKETAEELGVSVRTVARLKKNKQISFQMVRGSLKFKLSDLQEYCKQRTLLGR
jgi:excisionase family DNA binding protein